MAINYVKFQRGPQSAYESLKALGKIDPNTLYFIYSQDDSNTTSLYMGEHLIIGGNSSSINLNDLKDVIINDANENSFLVKNANEQWISKSLEDVVNLIQQNFTDNVSIFNVASDVRQDIIFLTSLQLPPAFGFVHILRGFFKSICRFISICHLLRFLNIS